MNRLFWRRFRRTYRVYAGARDGGMNHTQAMAELQVVRDARQRRLEREVAEFGFRLDPALRCDGPCGRPGAVVVRDTESWCLNCGRSYFWPTTRAELQAAGLFWERKA